MPNVELIYDADCPNYPSARTQILKAFAIAGLTPHWKEWDRNSSESPAHVKQFGSPTILVNGQDVVSADSSPDSCRLYDDGKGKFHGVPSIEMIASALKKFSGDAPESSWKRFLALLPVIGTAFLPKLICPACWPAYAGILSALGLGFVNYTPFLLPLTISFLVIVLWSLGFRASQRHGYYPLIAGTSASAVLLIGKFIFNADSVMYGGLSLLIGACLWNSWPLKTTEEACPSCSSQPKGGCQNETQKKN